MATDPSNVDIFNGFNNNHIADDDTKDKSLEIIDKASNIKETKVGDNTPFLDRDHPSLSFQPIVSDTNGFELMENEIPKSVTTVSLDEKFIEVNEYQPKIRYNLTLLFFIFSILVVIAESVYVLKIENIFSPFFLVGTIFFILALIIPILSMLK